MPAAQDLSTLVIEEGGVPADRLDDALQRQVLQGGGLDTVLLEMGLLDEETLLRMLSRSEGLPAVGKEALDAADRGAVAMFPRRLAEKHGIVPLSVDGRVLSVAVARKPDMALLDEIGFMLSVYVRPYVTTEVRIGYALQRLFSVPLPPRLASLLGLLGEELVDDEASTHAAEEAPDEEPASEAGEGEWSVTSTRLAVTDAASLAAAVPAEGAEAVGGLLGGAGESANPALSGTPPTTADEARQRLLARVAADDVQERTREEQRRTERVRWSVDDAIAEIALADERDEMLDVTLRFAYRRLSTVAIFVAQRSATGGGTPGFVLWDLIHPTLGKRDTKDRVVSRTEASVLSRLHEIRSPFLGPVAEDDPLVSLFGARPRAALLVPIIVGDVLAGALYGDNGERAVPPSSLAELHMVVPRLGKALRNLILRRKQAAGDEAQDAARAVTLEPRAAPAAVPVIEVDLDDLDEELDGALAGMSAESAGSFSGTGEPVVEPSPAPAPAPTRPSPPPLPNKTSAPAVAETKHRQQPPPLPKREPARAPVAALEANDAAEARTLERPSAATLGAPPPSLGRAPAVSPGASARETILLATWRDWLKFEDGDTDELLGGLHQPGDAGRLAASTVVARGDDAMPSLARYFPGVLSVHPFGQMESRPDVANFSDAAACLVRLGADRAAPILVGELGHDDRLHRYTAVWCLSELFVPAALPRLAQRAFDPELRIALLALEVLDGYREVPGFAKVLDWLREFLRRGDVFQRKRAILAAAELRDREALDMLVNLLGTRPKEVAEEARRALVEITLQDYGLSERRWRAWIADNVRQPRTSWLIEGLSNKDAEVRERAQQELNRVTGENFGYRADAPRKDREASVSVWTAWWAEQPPGRWP